MLPFFGLSVWSDGFAGGLALWAAGEAVVGDGYCAFAVFDDGRVPSVADRAPQHGFQRIAADPLVLAAADDGCRDMQFDQLAGIQVVDSRGQLALKDAVAELRARIREAGERL